MIQYLITAFIDIVVGILALSKKENPAAKALGLTICCLGFWSLELYFLTSITNKDLLDILFHLTRWGMFLAPSFFTLLTWRLLGSRSISFKKIIMIPSFCMAIILSAGNLLIFPSTLTETDGGYIPKPDFIFYSFGLYFIWCFLGSLVFVASSYKTSLSREKQRLKWVLITLLVCFLIGVLLIKSMPQSFYLSKFMGPIANIVFVALLFYTTIQHNLMDFRFVLSVGLSKAILLGFFVWLYFVVTSIVGDHTESSGGVLALLVFVAFILEAYPKLLKWILPNAKKIIIKHGYEYDEVKQIIQDELKNALNFSAMHEVLDHLFLNIIKLRSHKILILQPDDSMTIQNSTLFKNRLTPGSVEIVDSSNNLVKYFKEQYQLVMADEMPPNMRAEMTKHDAALCIPIFSNEKILALILLGEVNNLSYYRYDDIKIFEWLKSELGQVFDRLIRLDKMQDQLGEAKKTLSMLNLMNHYHHDIKAPFAIIDGVLSNDIYDRDKQREIVLAQVERGSRLIATMASILGGHHQRRVIPCNLGMLIEDCLYLFEASFDKIDLNLIDLPRIHGDAEDLKILFINLFKNAAEARRRNEELNITVNSWRENGNLYVSIQDNGIGMTENQLANLWEPSFSTKELGNGIGMQAIKRIVDEHGAHIAVKSELATGTKFTLCFFAGQVAEILDNDEQIEDELALRRSTLLSEKRDIQ
jgi:signal transduction histidine kinase